MPNLDFEPERIISRICDLAVIDHCIDCGPETNNDHDLLVCAAFDVDDIIAHFKKRGEPFKYYYENDFLFVEGTDPTLNFIIRFKFVYTPKYYDAVRHGEIW